jgi:hypothetical protein
MASARERAKQAKLDAKVDALTQGLAHPLRRSILYHLADEANGNKPTSPNELSKRSTSRSRTRATTSGSSPRRG